MNGDGNRTDGNRTDGKGDGNRRGNPWDGRVGLAGFDVYQVSRQLYRKLVDALGGVQRSHAAKHALDAAESTVLNVGEAHPALGADKARRFRIAAGEASEVGAALDLLEIRGVLGGERLRELQELGDRQRAMLWRLSRPR